MSAVTIPKDLHARMVRTYRREYEDEFGPLDEQRAFTREELVQKYAADLRFWKQREPTIDAGKKRPDVRTVCQHAIATNAIANMWRLCADRGIREDVERVMGTLEALKSVATPVDPEKAIVEVVTEETR